MSGNRGKAREIDLGVNCGDVAVEVDGVRVETAR
jgi:hypothetical protein